MSLLLLKCSLRLLYSSIFSFPGFVSKSSPVERRCTIVSSPFVPMRFMTSSYSAPSPVSSVRTMSRGFSVFAGFCCFLSWSHPGCIVFMISPRMYGWPSYVRGLPITSAGAPTCVLMGVSKVLTSMLPVPSSITISFVDTMIP